MNIDNELYEISSTREPIKPFNGHIRVQYIRYYRLVPF